MPAWPLGLMLAAGAGPFLGELSTSAWKSFTAAPAASIVPWLIN